MLWATKVRRLSLLSAACLLGSMVILVPTAASAASYLSVEPTSGSVAGVSNFRQVLDLESTRIQFESLATHPIAALMIQDASSDGILGGIVMSRWQRWQPPILLGPQRVVLAKGKTYKFHLLARGVKSMHIPSSRRSALEPRKNPSLAGALLTGSPGFQSAKINLPPDALVVGGMFFKDVRIAAVDVCFGAAAAPCGTPIGGSAAPDVLVASGNPGNFYRLQMRRFRGARHTFTNYENVGLTSADLFWVVFPI